MSTTIIGRLVTLYQAYHADYVALPPDVRAWVNRVAHGAGDLIGAMALTMQTTGVDFVHALIVSVPVVVKLQYNLHKQLPRSRPHGTDDRKKRGHA